MNCNYYLITGQHDGVLVGETSSCISLDDKSKQYKYDFGSEARFTDFNDVIDIPLNLFYENIEKAKMNEKRDSKIVETSFSSVQQINLNESDTPTTSKSNKPKRKRVDNDNDENDLTRKRKCKK